MSEINLGQFIKNAFNYSIGKPPTKQPTAASQENFQQAQQQTMKMINETVQNLQRNFIQQADIMNTQMQLKQLNAMERSMLIKDLFNFPQDMKDLMAFLAKDANLQRTLSSAELNLLLSKNLDMSKLMILLQTSGKTALEKVAKMITTLNQSGIYDTRQLKEMTTLINACIPASDTSSAAMIKNLLIMYLPWLPLHEKSGINIGFEEEQGKEKNDSENIVTITVMTQSFGLVKIVIYKDNANLNIEVNCTENFPKKEFLEAIKSESTGYNLNSGVTFTTRKTDDTEAEKKETKINISNSSKISPHLLLIIHTVINLIMALDKKVSLVNSRSQKI